MRKKEQVPEVSVVASILGLSSSVGEPQEKKIYREVALPADRLHLRLLPERQIHFLVISDENVLPLVLHPQKLLSQTETARPVEAAAVLLPLVVPELQLLAMMLVSEDSPRCMHAQGV